jgi:hypothetical protein
MSDGSLSDFLKPHKREAALRIRNSTFALLSFVLITHLLPPLPNFFFAWHVLVGGGNESGTVKRDTFIWWISAIGMHSIESKVFLQFLMFFL